MTIDPYLCVGVVAFAALVGMIVAAGGARRDDRPDDALSIFDSDVGDALDVAAAARGGCGCLGCTQAAEQSAAPDRPGSAS